MNSIEVEFEKALKKIALMSFQKILLVDLINNSFSFLQVEPFTCELKEEISSVRFSRFATEFIFSRHCHPEDRDKTMSFLDIATSKKLFEDSNGAVQQLLFRKSTTDDPLNFFPTQIISVPIMEDGVAVKSFLFIKNLTEEKQNFLESFTSFSSESARYKTNASGKRSILVIEDEEESIEELHSLLDLDYELDVVPNEIEAFNVLQTDFHKFSLILLCFHLKDRGGQKFLQAIQNDAFLSNIPAVVMLDAGNTSEKQEAIQLGATDYISKPFVPDIVKFHIHNFIHVNETPISLAAVEYDEITNVYTRAAFNFYAKKLLLSNPTKEYALIIMDIANFDSIVERYSFSLGNSIMKIIATSLNNPPKGVELIVGRFDTSKFIVLGYSDHPLTYDNRFSVYDRVKETYPNIQFDFKMGVYEMVDHNTEVPVLCDRVLTSLETIRNKYGVSIATFDLKAKIAYEKRIFVENSMQDALDKNEFVVFYQPKHDAKTGKLVGAEALLRWKHPEMGFLPPPEFIPYLESTGFIVKVDKYVWTRTCENLRKWINMGLKVVPISCNATKLDFEGDEFKNAIPKPVENYRLPKDLLHLEVTESMFIDNLDEYYRVLNAYRQEGYKIELDDFGAGYSSLVELSSLPLDYIKLDISLIRRSHEERVAKTIFSIVQLCKKLGLKVVAEGVETREQLRILRRMGIDVIQGYYYSKPLSEKDFEEYLRKFR